MFKRLTIYPEYYQVIINIGDQLDLPDWEKSISNDDIITSKNNTLLVGTGDIENILVDIFIAQDINEKNVHLLISKDYTINCPYLFVGNIFLDLHDMEKVKISTYTNISIYVDNKQCPGKIIILIKNK